MPKMLRHKTLHNWAGASVKTRIGCLFQIKYIFRGLITLDSHAPNKLHEPIDVLVADSYNLDNNEIGIGQDCAATLGVVREIFAVLIRQDIIVRSGLATKPKQ